jgi:hypothetical protein
MTGCSWFPMRHEEIQAWVEEHRHELPQTLAELSRFPIPFRKAIVAAVAPERQIRFWREHLESFIGPESRLTPDQQELVRDSIADLPGIFGVPRPEGQERLRNLEARMRDQFTRQQAVMMFGVLGPLEPPEGLPLPPGAHPTGVPAS